MPQVRDQIQAYSEKGAPVAAVIVEPIQAEGGDNYASADFFRQLQAITKEVSSQSEKLEQDNKCRYLIHLIKDRPRQRVSSNALLIGTSIHKLFLVYCTFYERVYFSLFSNVCQ